MPLDAHLRAISPVIFWSSYSSDGKNLATVEVEKNSFHLWDISTADLDQGGTEIFHAGIGPALQHEWRRCSSNGKMVLASIDTNFSLRVRELVEGTSDRKGKGVSGRDGMGSYSDVRLMWSVGEDELSMEDAILDRLVGVSEFNLKLMKQRADGVEKMAWSEGSTEKYFRQWGYFDSDNEEEGGENTPVKVNGGENTSMEVEGGENTPVEVEGKKEEVKKTEKDEKKEKKSEKELKKEKEKKDKKEAKEAKEAKEKDKKDKDKKEKDKKDKDKKDKDKKVTKENKEEEEQMVKVKATMKEPDEDTSDSVMARALQKRVGALRRAETVFRAANDLQAPDDMQAEDDMQATDDMQGGTMPRQATMQRAGSMPRQTTMQRAGSMPREGPIEGRRKMKRLGSSMKMFDE
ncbi:hypothetical protein BGZ95_005765 [Linnemannia exigua]|uniref:Uncharacterized protein n=1 Tax=Linnemannia exigua TaxID=604196 RepID=A0AAD4D1K5_9FUNG|nr:hypothetical protein BGZ95_005765 [Linnemannia exigua]